ncbi:hypothetical protein AVEN_51707-1 [Araneus ventricosus]|uniref:Uncharacterized protein n=1 Tax=Araneus ventricosus TaxID=182803 RepID=A0A4Y2GHS3_ARAVE|nr:hypothetical protein AVEN_51707-1 [Araneus ventricosus]
MAKNKKGGQKDSNKSESNAAEISTKDNVTNKGKSGVTTSSGVTLKTAVSTGNCQSSEITPPNMSEKKRGKKDNVRSRSVTFATIQSDVEVSKNKDKNATGKGSDNLTPNSQEVALSSENSKKKRRRRGKSAPGTSGTETLASAEYEGHKLDFLDMFSDIIDMQKLIVERISAIESGAAEPKSIKHMHKYKMECSPSEEEKRKTTFKTGDKNAQYSSKDNRVLVSSNESKTRDSIKPLKKVINISSGLTLKTARSAGSSQALANTPQNRAEEELEDKDNVKSRSVIHAAMQSNEEEAKNITGKDSDNLIPLSQEVESSAEKSKKKRRRNRGKSAPSTSGTGSLASSEYEGHKLDCPDTFLNKDVRELINARVSAIESGITEPKSIKYMHKYKIECSPSQEGKRKVTFNTGENVENPSKENQVTISDNDSKTEGSIRPVIFVTDKSTQTDPLQEPPNVSKHTDSKSNSALNSGSDCTVMGAATESDLLLPAEELNLENISEHIDMWKKYGSNLNPLDQNLQSIREDFLRDLKIASKKFEDGVTKCFKNEI